MNFLLLSLLFLFSPSIECFNKPLFAKEIYPDFSVPSLDTCTVVLKPSTDSTSFYTKDRKNEKSDSLIQQDFTYANVRDYVFQNFYYPAQAIQREIEGTVRIRFQLDTTGKVQHICVVKSAHPILDSAAIEIFYQMPRWKPVLHQGIPQTVTLTVPVIYELR